MPTEIIETFTAELLSHCLAGLHDRFHADYKNEKPNPLLKANYTVKGAEAVIEYKGDFYRITVEPFGRQKV